MEVLAWVCAGLVALYFVFRHLGRRARPPRGDALGPFLRHFEAHGVTPELAAAVFRRLQGWMRDGPRDHPVRPGDGLARVYGVAADELDEALNALIAECGRRPPRGASPDRPTPRATVESLVLYLAACPTRDEPPPCD